MTWDDAWKTEFDPPPAAASDAAAAAPPPTQPPAVSGRVAADPPVRADVERLVELLVELEGARARDAWTLKAIVLGCALALALLMESVRQELRRPARTADSFLSYR